jgi:methionyl-tRNA synthetase
MKFHTIFWPAMLISLGLELPKAVFVHGFITSEGQKMSKSLGNVVDPFETVKKYGVDAVRYYLLREIPSVDDGDFSIEKFEARYNADLAGGIGNLLARTLALANKLEIKPLKKIKNSKLQEETDKAKEGCSKFLDDFSFNEALKSIWDLIAFCNKYIDEQKPWETKNGAVIADLLLVLGEIGGLVSPFMPETSEKIKEQLKDKKSQPLFPRI